MPHQTRKIGDSLHCYTWQGRGNNCNTYVFANVLRGTRPHIIIDPGFVVNELREQCYASLTAAMEADGIKPEDIGLVINTHVHPDHSQATDDIVAAGAEASGKPRGKAGPSQAITALSREEYEYFRNVGEKMFGMFGLAAPKLEPFLYLSDGDLSLGTGARKIDLQVILTPGHSPGSISLYWPKEKALITGDVVFFGSIGRTDFPGGSISQLKQSIDRLSTLDVEYLLPGHSTEYGSIVSGRQMVQRNFSAVKMII